jgi:hypothetical protein
MAFRGGADEFAALVDRHARRGRRASLISQNDRLAVLYDSNAAVQRPEIDADYRARHGFVSAGMRNRLGEAALARGEPGV